MVPVVMSMVQKSVVRFLRIVNKDGDGECDCECAGDGADSILNLPLVLFGLRLRGCCRGGRRGGADEVADAAVVVDVEKFRDAFG